MRSCFRSALLLLIAGVALTACSRPAARAPARLALYFTCDTNGRLEPCGCFSGQHGGLTRLKTYLRADAASSPLLVDVGDALEGTADYQVIKYGYVQRAFAGMGFSALNMGAREARLSAAELRKLQEHAPVPMLSANLFDAATGARLCEPYRIVEYQGYQVALVGVVDAPRGAEDVGPGVAWEPMQTALAKLLPELRGKADLMVLLAFADEAALKALARQFYEFDVILGGKVKQPSQKLEVENRSVVLATTNESKAVGYLQGTINGPSKLTPSQFEIVFLDDQIAQDEALRAESRGYQQEIRLAKLAVDDPEAAHADEVPGVKAKAQFVGTAACATCHAGAAQKWQESGHAHAFAGLVERGSDADPSCIGCHTVGFGSPSGYRREFAGRKMAEVGCEACHGAGSEHVAQRQSGEKVLFRYRPLGAADCVSCHHGEFSRPFEFDKFWPLIEHGKELTTAQR